MDFKTKATVRDKEGGCIKIKGAIQEEDITLIDFCAPKMEAPKYVQKILVDIKGEINRNTVIVRHFNTSLASRSNG